MKIQKQKNTKGSELPQNIILKNESVPCPLTQQQLHFFSLPTSRGNTLLDYDLLPRFFHDRGNKKIPVDIDSNQAPRMIKMNDAESYEIIPAILNLEDHEGKVDSEGNITRRNYAVYPGTRESLIEDCLIYFARNGEFSIEKGEPGYKYDQGSLGVFFTLYQLRLALKAQGKEYRLDELREGLEVLAMAKYRYRNDEDRDRLRGYVVSELDSVPNPRPNDKIRSDRIMYVLFDNRASKRILGGHYRTYDDGLALSMKSPIARYLYKQFTHYWQNANNRDEGGSFRSVSQNETILASGCPLSSNATKRKTLILKALNELVEGGIILPLEEDVDVVPLKDGRKVFDINFMVRPTNKFIKQQIEGYKRLQETRRVGKKMAEINQL